MQGTAAPAALARAGAMGWAMRALMRIGTKSPEFASIVERADESMPSTMSARLKDLLEFMLALISQARPAREQAKLQAAFAARMTAKQRIAMKRAFKTSAEVWFEEGERKGLKEGRAEGRAKGVEEGVARGEAVGRIAALQDTVLRIGTNRLGAPSARTRTSIGNITDIQRLQRMIDAAQDAGTWKDVLAA